MKFFQVRTAEETYRFINEMVPPISEVMTKSLLNALHFVLAEDIIARENVPNFRRSSVDGYAVRAKDTFGSSENMPGFLTLTGEVKMGEVPEHALGTEEAMYVPTGGMIPEGSDAVIMIEHCEDISGLLNTYRPVAPGENVISVGEDIQSGKVLLEKGTKLRSQEIGALASQGIMQVKVWRQPIIGYLSSGDEIVPMETEMLKMGEVRDMNAATIGALVKEWGFEFIYGGIVQDDAAVLKDEAQKLLAQCDILLLSGGSSVGTKDYSVEVIDSLGEPGVFVHGIAIKPGKPTILSIANHKPIIGLPGHPASALIIFQHFGKAVIDRVCGIEMNQLKLSTAKVTKNIPSATGRTDYIRVRLFEENDEWYADPILGKSSLISTLVKSDGMIEIASESEGVHKGDTVPVTLFR